MRRLAGSTSVADIPPILLDIQRRGSSLVDLDDETSDGVTADYGDFRISTRLRSRGPPLAHLLHWCIRLRPGLANGIRTAP